MRVVATMVSFVVARALAYPALILVRLLGLVLAATLICAVSLYSQAMDDALLQANVGRDSQATQVQITQSDAPLSQDAYLRLDSYARHQLATDLGLPVLGLRAFSSTDPTPVFRVPTSDRIASPVQPGSFLGTAALEYYEDLSAHVALVDGSLAGGAALKNVPAGDIPVALSLPTARALKANLGDHLVLSAGRRQILGHALVVVATFLRTDPNNAFWGNNAGTETYSSLVVLDRATQFAAVQSAPWLHPKVYWFGQTLISSLRYSAAQHLIDSAQRISNLISVIAPGTVFLLPLSQDVSEFLSSYALLDTVLYILVAPVIALLLYALAVLAALSVRQQSREVVLLRGRGAGRSQLSGLYVFDNILLGIISVLIGPFLGLPLAGLMARSSGFLQFSSGISLSPAVTPVTFGLAALVVALAVLASLVPALGLTRSSMSQLLRRVARPARPGGVALGIIGFILLFSIYGYSVMARQGRVATSDVQSVLVQDPVVAVAPVAFVVAIALLLTWVLPSGASLLLWLGGSQRMRPAIQLALTHLARTPGLAVALVRLLILTVSLGVFAASIAGVVGQNTRDASFYAAGSTVRLEEFDQISKQYRTLPITWHLALPGVQAASPALRLESNDTLQNSTSAGVAVDVLGIDSATLRSTMWWRSDFANQSLAALLQTVQNPGPAAIVSDNFLSTAGVKPGDHVDITLINGKTLSCVVAAQTRLFPTLDPSVRPFIIVNLATLMNQAGISSPSEYWLRAPETAGAITTVLQAARDRSNQLVNGPKFFEYTGLPISFSAADDPLQAGIYGVISVGFLVALALAILGLIAHFGYTQRERVPEFAIVRALGFGPHQVRWLLLSEQLILLLGGVLGGIVGGALVSRLFLPYLPLAQSSILPFIVTIPWAALQDLSLILLPIFVLAFAVSAMTALRLPLAQTLRLGEQ